MLDRQLGCIITFVFIWPHSKVVLTKLFHLGIEKLTTLLHEISTFHFVILNVHVKIHSYLSQNLQKVLFWAYCTYIPKIYQAENKVLQISLHIWTKSIWQKDLNHSLVYLGHKLFSPPNFCQTLLCNFFSAIFPKKLNTLWI